ncbi:MAG: hypothetical protein ABGY41_11930 [Candidatus Poribacteria bacterium]
MWIAFPATVGEEYDRTVAQVLETVERAWRDLCDRTELAGVSAIALGVATVPYSLNYDRDLRPQLAALRTLVQALAVDAIVLRPDAECGRRALERSVRGDPPTAHTRPIADGLIVEHALELARRTSDAAGSVVFLSSNKEDYFPGGGLAEPLRAEMEGAGLEFASTWDWAGRLLGLLTT